MEQEPMSTGLTDYQPWMFPGTEGAQRHMELRAGCLCPQGSGLYCSIMPISAFIVKYL